MNQNADINNGEIYPLLLPHVTILKKELFIGTEKIRSVTSEEESICLLCNGVTPLSDILANEISLNLIAELSPFIIELPFPLVQDAQQNKTQRVLVISPNPQTGYLSVGGICLKWQDKEIKHLICFADTADGVHNGLFPNADEISAIRYDEAEICAGLCNCSNEFLNYPDFSRRKIQWQTGSQADLPSDLAAALKLAIYNTISNFKPDVILAPAGIGNHPDNLILHNIMVDFFKRDYFPGIDFFLYQDFPYAVAYNMVDDFLWKIENSFVKINDHFEDVTEQMSTKNILYDIYFSAFLPVNRSLVSHIVKRNVSACAIIDTEEIEGVEHFYKLIPFNA
jgi:hypothetical protein